LRLTAGKGIDIAIEAVGIPERFDASEQIVAAGGHIANIGVHGKGAIFHLDKLWDRNITLTTRLVDIAATGMLLKAVASGALKPKCLITHRFTLAEIVKDEVFGHAARNGALKVVMSAE